MLQTSLQPLVVCNKKGLLYLFRVGMFPLQLNNIDYLGG